MDKDKIYKIVVAVITCISTVAGILLVQGCAGMQFDCKGSYCIKKVN